MCICVIGFVWFVLLLLGLWKTCERFLLSQVVEVRGLRVWAFLFSMDMVVWALYFIGSKGIVGSAVRRSACAAFTCQISPECKESEIILPDSMYQSLSESSVIGQLCSESSSNHFVQFEVYVSFIVQAWAWFLWFFVISITAPSGYKAYRQRLTLYPQ